MSWDGKQLLCLRFLCRSVAKLTACIWRITSYVPFSLTSLSYFTHEHLGGKDFALLRRAHMDEGGD